MVKFDIVWYRHDANVKCSIGTLVYDHIWEFHYDEDELKFASQLGFVTFPEFPQIDKLYQSKTLFNTFDSRIRRENQVLSEEEKLRLLELTKGALVTDNIIIAKQKEKSKVK